VVAVPAEQVQAPALVAQEAAWAVRVQVPALREQPGQRPAQRPEQQDPPAPAVAALNTSNEVVRAHQAHPACAMKERRLAGGESKRRSAAIQGQPARGLPH